MNGRVLGIAKSRTCIYGLCGVVAISLMSMSTGWRTSAAASGTVNVFYAGSLVNTNENLIGPAFAGSTGYTYQGKAAGSLAVANQIKDKIATPDVVEFADPGVNKVLMGAANGNYISWYLTYARTQMVIGFDPRSKYAPEFRKVQHRKLAWYRPLEQHGLRLGRTDPKLDPKGYRAIWVANLAQRLYHLKHFKRNVLGANDNPAQVFPEEVLVARMLTGQLDAGVFYLSEVKDLGIPYITLPNNINLGEAKYRKVYATQHFTVNGVRVTGAPIQYTISIPSTVKNLPGATAFVRFVLGQRVRAVAGAHGLLPLKTTVGGDARAVPSGLTDLIGET
ncbi:MAG: extracellular solute-binding protein [Chloroflexota bacterium]